MSDEGSVFVEGMGGGTQETSDESQPSQSEETTQDESLPTEESSGGDESNSTFNKNDNQEGVEYTEKGTKLDPNPLSRVNQELANERRKIKQYEEVLNNPTLLRGYVAQFDKGDKKEEVQIDEPEMRAEDIQTTEDLQKFVKQQEQRYEKKLKELDSTISQVKESTSENTIAARITNDIVAVRGKYDELDPKPDKDGNPTNPNYNKELDAAVGNLYERFDFDPQKKTYKGSVSILEIADIVMNAAGSSKKQGSREAQTIVRERRSGKAVSGASTSSPDESSMSASQIIAARVAAARGHR
jgi:hypothetical protein